METILGLDLGTNSIGGALIELDTENFGKQGRIIWTGSRIVPVDGDALQKFESGGQVETKAAARRQKRGSRRLKHRYKLRRTRLIKTMKTLGWIPANFPTEFKEAKKNGVEFKMKEYLPFTETTLNEAAEAFKIERNKKGEINVPEDWVVYYLRKKALTQKIKLPELARILYMLNQRRGFKSSRKDLQDETKILPYKEFERMTKNGEFVDHDGKTLETKFVEFTKIKAVEWIEDEGQDNNGNYTFRIYPESARMKEWEEKRKKKPEWEGKEFRFLVTQKTKKSGKEYKIDQLKPQIPGDNDWNLAMVSLDEEIDVSGKQVGEFFFDKLVEDKNYRIRQQVVKRARYQKELEAIWNEQSDFHPELKSKDKLEDIARMLYPTQSEIEYPKWKEITNGTLLDVISKDIIYYQRDLKSQKNLIDECRYEKKTYTYKDKEGKEISVTEGYRVAPKSCPEFQEFRIWQDLHNLRIIQLEDELTGKVDIDVSHLLTNEKKAELFELFDKQEEVKQSQLLKKINKSFSEKTHRINLFANRKTLKGNETKAFFRKVFKKYDFDGEHLLNDKDKFQLLWHILYSITGKDHEKGIRKALTNPKNGFGLPKDVVEHLATKTKEFPSQYAAYSRKAIKKLLPLMRCGMSWNSDAVIDAVSHFLEWKQTSAFSELGNKIQNELEPLEALEDFEGLQTSTACYVVYGRHSERESNEKLKSIEDFKNHIRKNLPQNSLRNPIVEQVVRETMQVVKDIWETYGRPDEIHIEMGRDLKNSADDRKKISDNQTKNFNEKQRIKKLLQELKNGNPESPIDIEKFRIWKEQAGKEGKEEFDNLFVRNKNDFVSNADIEKYRLWAEQNHRSPYTGETIPLSKLFTEEYEKEHIIPRSRLKYDAMANLVICEASVNKFKGDRLAMEMIETDGGRGIPGTPFTLLTKDAYLENCRTFDYSKRKNLLADEVPEDFIERQINDTRHITRRLAELLWPVAKDKEGLVFTVGSITNDLKQQWGINTEWKKLLKPRFKRLGKILNEELIEEDGNKFHLRKPDEKVDLKRIDHRHHAMDALVIAATTRAHINYLNALNSHEKKEKWKYVAKERVRDFHLPWPTFAKDVKDKLSEVIISHKYNNRVLRTPHNRYWKWEQQADGTWKKVLKKQQPNERWKAVKKAMFNENPHGTIWLKEPKPVRVIEAVKVQIERAKGKIDEKGNPRNYIYNQHARKQIRALVENFNGDLAAIKKYISKHKITNKVGEPIDKVKVAFFNQYAAKRVSLDDTFTENKIKNSIPYAEKVIEKWLQFEKDGYRVVKRNGKTIEQEFPSNTTQWPLAFLLYKHLHEKDENRKPKYNGPKEAFKGEGLEDLFKKAGRTINKITTCEVKTNPVRLYKGIWETAKGGNVYFVIQEKTEEGEGKGKREYYTPPLYSSEDAEGKDLGVINRLLNNVEIADKREGYRNIILKVGDLVYVPTPEELEHPHHIKEIDWNGEDKKRVFDRIYIVRKFTKGQCYFLPHNVASLLKKQEDKANPGEFGSQNLSEKTIDGNTTIKEHCLPIEVDRLGNIIGVDGRKIV